MAAMSKNCTILNKGQAIIVEKNSLQLKFNNEVKMQNGFLWTLVWSKKRALVGPNTGCLPSMMQWTSASASS